MAAIANSKKVRLASETSRKPLAIASPRDRHFFEGGEVGLGSTKLDTPLERDAKVSAADLPQVLPEIDQDGTAAPSNERLIALQRWEGVVTEVHDVTFTARVVDRASEHPDEEVVVDVAELADFDQGLLAPGVIVYWTIGYLERKSGSRRRVSEIRLRRVPNWTRAEIRAAQERAAKLAKEFESL